MLTNETMISRTKQLGHVLSLLHVNNTDSSSAVGTANCHPHRHCKLMVCLQHAVPSRWNHCSVLWRKVTTFKLLKVLLFLQKKHTAGVLQQKSFAIALFFMNHFLKAHADCGWQSQRLAKPLISLISGYPMAVFNQWLSLHDYNHSLKFVNLPDLSGTGSVPALGFCPQPPQLTVWVE